MHSLYEWFRTHRFAVDLAGMAALWLLFCGLALVGGNVQMGAVGTLLVVPLAWRRTRPAAAGMVIAAVALFQWASGIQPMPANAAVVLIVYALAAYGPRWASIGGLVLALLGGVLLVTRYYIDLSISPVANLPFSALLVVMVWVLVLFSWTLGDLTRTRRLREQALEERANRLEIEQTQERELAASDERAHIAREMHDIVAHSLSVIITQADGARYAAAADPQVAITTLKTIADTGRGSLQEMRRLLGVLRGADEATTRPLPGLADVEQLLLSIRALGLPVQYAVVGTARRRLPPGAELTVYRVVQEGLTNVVKHAGPNAAATVSLQWQSRGLNIRVEDDGRGAAAHPLQDTGPLAAQHPAPRVPGSGNGLLGMAERVKLYDGQLSAKPRPGGGFAVAAFIPYTEA
ncbi:sensor histidine kinase [Pseudarthrobacter sp. P1]|uniref:sensor histidine kinase n=1 Tax=Pseudarthrobacter sp. P1 TaxID=3418418 RepID=UPI003CEEB4BE